MTEEIKKENKKTTVTKRKTKEKTEKPKVTKSRKPVSSDKEAAKSIKTKVIRKKIKAEKENLGLKDIIIKGIQNKKGEDIIVIDFNNIKNSICDYFIICQGGSNRQVESIADGIEEMVRKTMGIKPAHKEGFETSQWILLDYFDVVVHIFQPETRNFFKLEELWGDAEQIGITN